MAPRTDFPPVRACLFDMDGLLLDTEDIYTQCINVLLKEHSQTRTELSWDIKAKLQGRPGPAATEILLEWADLKLTPEEYMARIVTLHQERFPTTKPLAGVPELLANLVKTQKPVHIALATSSHLANFKLKTDHLTDLFSVFPVDRRVLGDDARLQRGRGKPLPDIFLLALDTINSSLPEGEEPIKPEECLVFEDSVPGVEAGRRAGMRVIWCPHKELKAYYAGREAEVLAGRTGEAGEVDMHQLGELDDGWAEELASLEDFSYEKYGIVVPQ
ncbi:HAD-like protein [Trichoderma citrinoviride]|uniref:HAD-like protein n=1 Tax=Trichoderma citrinoviride TaxID=58853 RepID=A0A2T4BE55_9HYPO|nr:HAD-like protein [Trichoderma citrinoviride]PTB67613.1 HAD-like protein [Trichoderma citrinoviride]